MLTAAVIIIGWYMQVIGMVVRRMAVSLADRAEKNLFEWSVRICSNIQGHGGYLATDQQIGSGLSCALHEAFQ